MHVVWNIVENSYIDREQNISAIRFFNEEINKLPKNENSERPNQASNDIITYLAGTNESLIKNIFGRRQLIEEIVKAKQIKSNNGWKDKIYTAEKFAFFKGTISFLFNNEKGETDWNNFNIKFETAKLFFDNNGIKADYKIQVLHTLYSYCNDWDTQFWWNARIFDGSARTWKGNILLRVNSDNSYTYALPIHHLLMGNQPLKDATKDRNLRLLSNESFVKFLVEENSKDLEMYIRSPHCALYYCGCKYGVMLDFEKRDKLLNMLLDKGIIELTDSNKRIKEVELFWGNFDINFIYHTQKDHTLHLQWYHNNYDIYLMTEEWNYKMRENPKNEEQGDRIRFYCFNITDSTDHTSSIESFCRQVESEFADFI